MGIPDHRMDALDGRADCLLDDFGARAWSFPEPVVDDVRRGGARNLDCIRTAG